MIYCVKNCRKIKECITTHAQWCSSIPQLLSRFSNNDTNGLPENNTCFANNHHMFVRLNTVQSAPNVVGFIAAPYRLEVDIPAVILLLGSMYNSFKCFTLSNNKCLLRSNFVFLPCSSPNFNTLSVGSYKFLFRWVHFSCAISCIKLCR